MLSRRTVEVEVVVSDVDGREVGKTGWVLVRRQDGLEVAHFSGLYDITNHGDKIVEAALDAVYRHDGASS